MGKCGSTAIQRWLASTKEENIDYITYPGEIDANPIISDFLSDPRKLPASVVEAMRHKPLEGAFHEYIIDRINQSSCKFIILSAEHISWLLDEEETSRFVEKLIVPVSRLGRLMIIAYFRIPPESRYLSTLQEDAKYNHKIRLYIPNWPYSENHNVYMRWADICSSLTIEWVPVAFSRELLENGDVVSDFIKRAGMFSIKPAAQDEVNKSIDPVSLCAYRSILGESIDRLAWDRKSELLTKVESAMRLVSSHLDIRSTCIWRFRPEISEYIAVVSSEEYSDIYVNLSGREEPAHAVQRGEWDPLLIEKTLPYEVSYTDGYLTGPLDAFLEGIDMVLVKEMAILVKSEILAFFSRYYGEI